MKMKMKLSVLHVISLLVCLMQICVASNEWAETRNELGKNFRKSIYGVGEQFVDDFLAIADKFQNNSYVVNSVGGAIPLYLQLVNKTDSKIDINDVRAFHMNSNHQNTGKFGIDELKLFQTILSKQLPPERYNGYINLEYALGSLNATSEEIETSLNYLYGIDTEATKISFLDVYNFPDLDATDCPYFSNRVLSERIEKFKLIVDIKPKVAQDLTTIFETLPCDMHSTRHLSRFIDLIEKYHGDKSKITACVIKESPANWFEPFETMKYDLMVVETIFSARLAEDTFRGINNFVRATLKDTSIAEIEKALEYLYDDVPKTECPASEGSN